MPKVYIYKLTTDDGGAPCVWNRTLSLAICKPAIRASAPVGSFLLGFAAKPLYSHNALVYAARVTWRLESGEYFTAPEFRGRPDRIYALVNGRFEWIADANYHSPRDVRHDLGLHPDYKRANVLLSEGSRHFRYFGGDGGPNYKAPFPALKRLVEGLAQGHRVNHSMQLVTEVDELIEQIFSRKPIYRRTKVPDSACGGSCDRGGDAFHIIDAGPRALGVFGGCESTRVRVDSPFGATVPTAYRS